ncbi:MAG: AAA family ATPase [Candidatus Aenigmarchaeota archaeon]|nr:AAA family ATPase [Candidatus Aenigmarchaeota archaeon]
MQKILGIVGRIGAGKDTVADYVARKYGYAVVAFRDAVKDVTEKEGLELTRENMQHVGKKYRADYGEDFFTKVVAEKAERAGGKVIIKEMRTDGDVLPLKDKFRKAMKIICVDADAEKRFARMLARGRTGDPQTREEFEKQEKHESELGFTAALSHATVGVDNNGTLGELYEKIDKLLKAMEYD